MNPAGAGVSSEADGPACARGVSPTVAALSEVRERLKSTLGCRSDLRSSGVIRFAADPATHLDLIRRRGSGPNPAKRRQMQVEFAAFRLSTFTATRSPGSTPWPKVTTTITTIVTATTADTITRMITIIPIPTIIRTIMTADMTMITTTIMTMARTGRLWPIPRKSLCRELTTGRSAGPFWRMGHPPEWKCLN